MMLRRFATTLSVSVLAGSFGIASALAQSADMSASSVTASSVASSSLASSIPSSSTASQATSSVSSASLASAQSASADGAGSTSSAVSAATSSAWSGSSQSAQWLPEAKLTIEQKNDKNIVGTWTLLRSDGLKQTDKTALKTLSVPAGHYTLFFEAPKGTAASVRLYKGTETLQDVKRPQITFSIAKDEDLRVTVNYPFTRVGSVGVTSDPPGLKFTLSTPNGVKMEGVTPMSYEKMEVGQYSVEFQTLEGCVTPARKSDVLEDKGRVSFAITIACKAADDLRAGIKQTEEENVTTMVSGETFSFKDVPQDSWFAEVVFKVAEWGILSGYKNDKGELTGQYGPANNVTVAELAKIAHKVSGTNEREKSFDTKNPLISSAAWYFAFMTSAESRGWTIFADATINPDRDATRAEVLVTLLQALNVPIKWQKGTVFVDVNAMTPYAAAIETAYTDKVVSGRDNADGTPSGFFAPGDPINRAELAKMIVKAIETYRTPTVGN